MFVLQRFVPQDLYYKEDGLKYLSVCSGIEAASVAWHPLGWEPVAFSEIEPFPAAVLAHHYPNVPNLGDMTKYKEWPDATIDLLVGGTPCQSFSVAGLRKGLDDPRGNLMLTYLAIADRYRPKWLVWENVPGVLSSNGGRDFASLLRGLEECGYGFAYRILDAQFVRTYEHPRAVPQRRRRVFVVGCLGSWQRAAAVLFERESLSGNPAPSRKKGEGFAHDVAPSLTSSGRGVERAGETRGQDPVVAHTTGAGYWQEGFGTLRAREQESHEHLVAHTLRGEGFDASEDGTGRGTPLVTVMAHGQANAEIGIGRSPALTCNHEAPIVAFAQNQLGEVRTGEVANTLNTDSNASGRNTPMVCYPINTMAAIGRENEKNHRQTFGIGDDGDPQFTLQSAHSHAVAVTRPPMQVRRLTPICCERLQGFEDNYTNIPWRGKPESPDGPRYRALGNSMATNCMSWIGTRIKMVEEIK